MKKLLKRCDLLRLNNLVHRFVKDSEKYDKRFNFALYRNIEHWSGEMKALSESHKVNEKFKEYEEKKLKLGADYSDKDESGNPIMTNLNGHEVYVIKENKQEANGKIAELIKEYHDAIEDQKKNIEQVNELLDEEVEIDICQISFEYLPEDADYNSLKDIVKETVEEIEEKYL